MYICMFVLTYMDFWTRMIQHASLYIFNNDFPNLIHYTVHLYIKTTHSAKPRINNFPPNQREQT